MENVAREERRLQAVMQRYLKAPSLRWDDVPDPRSRRGRRWSLGTLVNALFVGMLAGSRSLRDVESLSERLRGGRGMGRGAPRRVPDTTLDGLLRQATAGPFVMKLHAQVREMKRAGALAPLRGLPYGVLTIDGKNLATLDKPANRYSQHKSQTDGGEHWLQRAARAVLTSCEAKVCVHQTMIPAETNDMGVFPAIYAEVLEAYGDSDLFRLVTADAGFTSLHNAGLIAESGRWYLLGLKEDQPKLLRKAEQLLLSLVASVDADACTGWERRGGVDVRRRLWRSEELNGFNGWTHLAQVLMVVQESRQADGEIRVDEVRFFVTSVPSNELTGLQLLHVVRGHWGIENDCFWSLDAQWKEDHGVWCTRNDAVEVLGLIRLLAYNVLQQLRKRHLPPPAAPGRKRPPPTRWQELFQRIRFALYVGAIEDTTATR